MLHNRRRRLAEYADREAKGESLWTSDFETRSRRRLLHWFEARSMPAYVYPAARTMILHDEGWDDLGFADHAVTDMAEFVLSSSNDMLPTAVEALVTALPGVDRDDFRTHVNTIFREDRISWELIGLQMVPFESREMHVAVVAPTLTLLGGRAAWKKAESAYTDALNEIATGNAADAITDAGTALQEGLLAAGAVGDALGPLISSAKKRGLLAAHDTKLEKAITDTMHWVSADRSSNGDAHHASDASVEDAWLIVHVVGALLLRLAGSTHRGATTSDLIGEPLP